MSTTPKSTAEAAYRQYLHNNGHRSPKRQMLAWKGLGKIRKRPWVRIAKRVLAAHFSLIGQRGGLRKTKAKLETGRILMRLINEGKDD